MAVVTSVRVVVIAAETVVCGNVDVTLLKPVGPSVAFVTEVVETSVAVVTSELVTLACDCVVRTAVGVDVAGAVLVLLAVMVPAEDAEIVLVQSVGVVSDEFA